MNFKIFFGHAVVLWVLVFLCVLCTAFDVIGENKNVFILKQVLGQQET